MSRNDSGVDVASSAIAEVKVNLADSKTGQVKKGSEEKHNEEVKQTESVKNFNKRAKVLTEIITSERSYVQDLKILTGLFLPPLLDDCLSYGLTKEELSTIFLNIEAILAINNELLTKLEKLIPDINQIDGNCKIGATLLQIGHFLKLYSSYCSNYKESLAIVLTCIKRSPNFAKFLQDAQENPKCKGLSLTDYLIKPIQRICKYPLLFRELLSVTPMDHPDYHAVFNTLKLFEDVSGSANKLSAEKENTQKLASFNMTVVGFDGFDHFIYGRRAIRDEWIGMVEGTAMISSAYVEPKHVYLFNDIFIVTKLKSKKTKTEVIQFVAYLSDLILLEVPEAGKHLFTISYKTEEPDIKQYLFICPSLGSKTQWITDIKSAIELELKMPSSKKTQIMEELLFIQNTNCNLSRVPLKTASKKELRRSSRKEVVKEKIKKKEEKKEDTEEKKIKSSLSSPVVSPNKSSSSMDFSYRRPSVNAVRGFLRLTRTKQEDPIKPDTENSDIKNSSKEEELRSEDDSSNADSDKTEEINDGNINNSFSKHTLGKQKSRKVPLSDSPEKNGIFSKSPTVKSPRNSGDPKSPHPESTDTEKPFGTTVTRTFLGKYATRLNSTASSSETLPSLSSEVAPSPANVSLPPIPSKGSLQNENMTNEKTYSMRRSRAKVTDFLKSPELAERKADFLRSFSSIRMPLKSRENDGQPRIFKDQDGNTPKPEPAASKSKNDGQPRIFKEQDGNTQKPEPAAKSKFGRSIDNFTLMRPKRTKPHYNSQVAEGPNFVPKCYACHENIPQISIHALDRFYHPDCFKCFTCKSLLKEINTGPENELYCSVCFNQQTAVNEVVPEKNTTEINS